MARGPPPPCVFHYNHGFNNQMGLKLTSNSAQAILKVFILINYIYFFCIAALFLYDFLIYKAFSYGHSVLTNYFKEYPTGSSPENAKERKRKSISFILPVPRSSSRLQNSSDLDKGAISTCDEEIDLPLYPGVYPRIRDADNRCIECPNSQTTFTIESAGTPSLQIPDSQQISRSGSVETPAIPWYNPPDYSRLYHTSSRQRSGSELKETSHVGHFKVPRCSTSYFNCQRCLLRSQIFKTQFAETPSIHWRIRQQASESDGLSSGESDGQVETDFSLSDLKGINFELLPEFVKHILYNGSEPKDLSECETNLETEVLETEVLETDPDAWLDQPRLSSVEDNVWNSRSPQKILSPDKVSRVETFTSCASDQRKTGTNSCNPRQTDAATIRPNLSRSMEDIVFDELNKIHILDPQIFDKTLQLKNEAGQFVDAVTSFQKIVNDLIGAAEKIGEEVEREKMKAIGSRNYIQSLAKQRENMQSELQSLIIEKSLEIERLRIEHESLLRTQAEQQEVLDGLELNA